jgi:hypothetical protein
VVAVGVTVEKEAWAILVASSAMMALTIAWRDALMLQVL